MGEYLSKSETETGDIAAVLAETLIPGDLVLLHGGLGAGKTAFARALLRALAGDKELEVPSPTFAIVQPYRFGDLEILHADLFRLSGENEVDELGLFDDPGALVLVEWSERCPALARWAGLEISFASVPMASGPAAPDHRKLNIAARPPERQADLDTRLATAGVFPLPRHPAGNTELKPLGLQKLKHRQNRAAPAPDQATTRT
jgi:tRNA threonylcarbamoyladenosine biosynthesis protein TsaE